MFAKLKKKVEDLEGSDLHKLANSISFSNSGGPEKSASSNSIKTTENLAASSQKGSTTSLSSMQGIHLKSDEIDANIAAEKKWKQRLVEIENEWRVKVMVQEHEKEQVAKDRDLIVQQKRKMEEEVKELRGISLNAPFFSDPKLLGFNQVTKKNG